MKNKISSVINILISVFLLVAVNTFFAPCKGAMEMPCGYSVKAADLVLILLVVISIGKLFVNDIRGRLILSITTIAAGAELLFVPQIGKCQIASMSCNTYTFPALFIGALLIIALTVIFETSDLLSNRRRGGVNDK